ncbi:hypothetical protein F383_33025 [Gossypium arboreum]|uniref:Uncharacterized protein n=1 Tax=Gossypium arboreum TaxID=29729 RepID=A0A0B0N767_GOSAR|nr:hypothetical protein F383_33025 [Gossypium arboreum]
MATYVTPCDENKYETITRWQCYQASSHWRSSEIASHYQTVILGIDDIPKLTLVGMWFRDHKTEA